MGAEIIFVEAIKTLGSNSPLLVIALVVCGAFYKGISAWVKATHEKMDSYNASAEKLIHTHFEGLKEKVEEVKSAGALRGNQLHKEVCAIHDKLDRDYVRKDIYEVEKARIDDKMKILDNAIEENSVIHSHLAGMSEKNDRC